MIVPFLDLKPAYFELQDQLDGAYRRVMESGCFVLGDELDAFELEFARYCGVKHCVGMGNGLDALHLLLRACDIGEGDEVIVPSHTYIATWLAVSYAGAVPTPVEPDARTFNLDPQLIEDAITPRTRAIMPVHLYGQPADMDPIREIANRRNLLLLDDAAQAHGARYRGNPIGGLGHAAGWSFYPGKNLGGYGDGGAVTTDDDHLAERLRMLRNYGSRTKYHHEVQGFNSRLDPLQAAFLRVRLSCLDEWNGRRKKAVSLYIEGLKDLPNLTLPYIPDWAEPIWHLFVIRHPKRDALQEHLRTAGIGTLIHYPIPPHLSAAYANSGSKENVLPIAENLARSVLSLPIGPHLKLSELEHVVGSVREFCDG